MNKRPTIFLFALIFAGLLTACSGMAAPTERVEDMTPLERIEAATTFDEITDCRRYSSSEVEADAIKNKVFEYLFSGTKINGTYYYNEQFIEDTWLAEKYGSLSRDVVVICSVDRDEIYFVPESELTESEIAAIPDIENAAEFRYRAKDAYVGDSYMSVYFLRETDNYELHVDFYENDGYIEIWDVFPNQYDEDGEETLRSSRNYYLDEAVSLQVSQETYDKEVAEKEEREAEAEKLAQSDPKVGMTANEVRGCAWGRPDKINKDTYSWGTSEQWVYRGKGYVYLKNGIVTSVSER